MPSESQTAFFSYCREDSEFALKLAEDLKNAGASVWIDQLDIEPGAEWDSAVEEALTNAPRMLVILSPVSVDSKNVRDEVSFALNEGKRVIPVLYRDCKVPFRLARLQQIDFRTDYARALKILLRAFGVEPPAPPPAAAASAANAEQLVAVVNAQQAAEQARTEEEEHKSTDLAARLTAIADAERAAARARVEEEERERKSAEEKEQQQKLEEERQAAAEQVAEQKPRSKSSEKVATEKLSKQRALAAGAVCAVGWGLCLCSSWLFFWRLSLQSGDLTYDQMFYEWASIDTKALLWAFWLALGTIVTAVAAIMTKRWSGWQLPLLFGFGWATAMSLFAFEICLRWYSSSLSRVAIAGAMGAIFGAIPLVSPKIVGLGRGIRREAAIILLSICLTWFLASLVVPSDVDYYRDGFFYFYLRRLNFYASQFSLGNVLLFTFFFGFLSGGFPCATTFWFWARRGHRLDPDNSE